ncbi:helix-turn-helix transcriptional regulator [Paenibacillus senegalensis]|uniref:helix-turn-helix transcriptional regulator n=1 Tax=Paenibacillus senegalensis TaxID=1465766 RepID=UPI000287ADC8|nr:response regulator transcription factor [Paenibacillus senegalensis]
MQKRSTRYFLKIFLLGCILSTIPVMVVGIFSYLKASNTIQTQVNEAKQQSLYQIQSNVEQLLKTIDHSMTYFVNSWLVKSSLDEPLTVEQFQLYNQIRQEMVHLQTFDTGIQNITLLSTEKDWLIDNSGLYRFHKTTNRDELLSYFELPLTSQWYLESPFMENRKRAEETAVVMEDDDLHSEEYQGDLVPPPDPDSTTDCGTRVQLIKKLPLNTVSKKGLASASIPACHIKGLFTYDFNHETVMIWDENLNPILIENAAVTELHSANLQSLLSRFREESASSNVSAGQFSIGFGQSEVMVNYRNSSYNGWTYFSLISVKEISKPSRTIGWFTFWICAALLLAALFMNWFGSRKIYKPVQSLFKFAFSAFQTKNTVQDKDEFEFIQEQIHTVLHAKSELESKLTTQIEQLKTFFMMKCYQGGVTAKEIEDKLQAFQYPAQWKGLSVLVLQIDTLEGTEYRDRDIDLLMFAINNMIEEIIPEDLRFQPVLFKQSQVTMMVNRNDSDSAFAQTLSETAKHIQSTVKTYLNLSVSFGISNTANSLQDAQQAYQEGLEALKHRIRLGDGAIIFFQDLPQGYSTRLPFPHHLQQALHDAIKLADRQAADEQLKAIFHHLSVKDSGPNEYELSLVKLLVDLIQLTRSLGIEAVSFSESRPIFDKLFKLGNKERMTWFRQKIIEPIIETVEERTKLQSKTISSQIIQIIRDEFHNDITLESIADRLHYNANYISSVFRKEMDISFSEYLATYRHEMAKKWLVETRMSVREISELLRYNNSQNFIRSFRKLEGITPGKYRELHTAD